jgi:ribosome modulation factor
VRTVESNASEPLMTCRKRRNGVKTGGESLLRDQSGGNLLTAQAASGMKVARMRSRLLCGTWEPVIPMPRERRKRKPLERLSTDAGYRGGATWSSEEGPVMGLERRGCPIRPKTRRQPALGGLS